MKNVFRIIAFTLFFVSSTAFQIQSTVYICLSPGAKKYHYSRSCRGLNNCTHEIKAVSKGTAEERGLDLCGWED